MGELPALPSAQQNADSRWGPQAFSPGGSADAGMRGAGESGSKHPLGRTDGTLNTAFPTRDVPKCPVAGEQVETSAQSGSSAMELRMGTKLFLRRLSAQAGWAQRAEGGNNEVTGKNVHLSEKNREEAPVLKTHTDRTDRHQSPPAAAGKDGWRGALAGIHVFINKLKLISLFTGSKTVQDSKPGVSQACGRKSHGADPHRLSRQVHSSRKGCWRGPSSSSWNGVPSE